MEIILQNIGHITIYFIFGILGYTWGFVNGREYKFRKLKANKYRRFNKPLNK